MASNAFKVVNFLHNQQIAHNVFITRGRSLSNQDESAGAIRILIWARPKVVGTKDPGDFCLAVCELAGQMLIYNRDAYDHITEATIGDAHVQAGREHQTVKPALLESFAGK